jgi:hypothetical protein
MADMRLGMCEHRNNHDDDNRAARRQRAAASAAWREAYREVADSLTLAECLAESDDLPLASLAQGQQARNSAAAKRRQAEHAGEQAAAAAVAAQTRAGTAAANAKAAATAAAMRAEAASGAATGQAADAPLDSFLQHLRSKWLAGAGQTADAALEALLAEAGVADASAGVLQAAVAADPTTAAAAVRQEAWDQRERAHFAREDRCSKRRERREQAPAQAARQHARAAELLASERRLTLAKTNAAAAAEATRRADLQWQAYGYLDFNGDLLQRRHAAARTLAQAERELGDARQAATLATNTGWARDSVSRQLAAARALQGGRLAHEVRGGAKVGQRVGSRLAPMTAEERARRLLHAERLATKRERDYMAAEDAASRARRRCERTAAKRARRLAVRVAERRALEAAQATQAAERKRGQDKERARLREAARKETEGRRAGQVRKGPAEVRYAAALRAVRAAMVATGERSEVFALLAARSAAEWRELVVAARRERATRATRRRVWRGAGAGRRGDGPATTALKAFLAAEGLKGAEKKAKTVAVPRRAPFTGEVRDRRGGLLTFYNPREGNDQGLVQHLLNGDEVAEAWGEATESDWSDDDDGSAGGVGDNGGGWAHGGGCADDAAGWSNDYAGGESGEQAAGWNDDEA